MEGRDDGGVDARASWVTVDFDGDDQAGCVDAASRVDVEGVTGRREGLAGRDGGHISGTLMCTYRSRLQRRVV